MCVTRIKTLKWIQESGKSLGDLEVLRREEYGQNYGVFRGNWLDTGLGTGLRNKQESLGLSPNLAENSRQMGHRGGEGGEIRGWNGYETGRGPWDGNTLSRGTGQYTASDRVSLGTEECQWGGNTLGTLGIRGLYMGWWRRSRREGGGIQEKKTEKKELIK